MLGIIVMSFFDLIKKHTTAFEWEDKIPKNSI